MNRRTMTDAAMVLCLCGFLNCLPASEIPRPPAVGILTRVPSKACGAQGVAVRVIPPLRPRYEAGAPVVIHVAGGQNAGAAVGPPQLARFGFVELYFGFPNGGGSEVESGGTYDYRGPDSIRALADVIRFATGRLADHESRTLAALLPKVKILPQNCGLIGFSHGGNACGVAMARYGGEFPDLAFYVSMESPYGDGAMNVELGGFEAGLNPAYNPETGVLDLSKLAYGADLEPFLFRRMGGATGLKGALFFDLNGDGKYSGKDDYPANVFVCDLGKGPRAWYSLRLLREAERRALFGEPRPPHIPTLEEAGEFWAWRDAEKSIAEAVRQCPKTAVIVYANARDHVQAAPDHPHIVAQIEGFRKAGAAFVRLNPDRAYVEAILKSAPPVLRERAVGTPADNDAGKAWDRRTIRDGCEPASLPADLCVQAAVCELADRTHAGMWSKNLDKVLISYEPPALPPGGAGKASKIPDKPLRRKLPPKPD
ncbi:MAG: hypothetical protein N3D11_01940 [Candidatus Sumerlaeia bacterium]|nr:hypothetical protein [Candidatus Sumerlaeia bacterium]